MPDRPLAAILLAAGMSRRMGRLKMLLPFGGKPMLDRVIELFREFHEVSSITVVCGHAEQEIRAAVGEYEGVAWAANPGHAAGGMLSSVKVGVSALPPSCEAFFLALGDQPMVQQETLRALAGRWHADTAPIVIPAFNGRRGHPVLIARCLAPEILALGENETLKTLMTRHASEIIEVEVPDPATIQDVDTPEDYEAALKQWRVIGGS